jgi:hypothetical protein
MSENLRPMSEFNPAKPSRVHDALNNQTLAWKAEWAAHYRQYAIQQSDGRVGWDGLILDGWSVGDVIQFQRRDEA